MQSANGVSSQEGRREGLGGQGEEKGQSGWLLDKIAVQQVTGLVGKIYSRKWNEEEGGRNEVRENGE